MDVFTQAGEGFIMSATRGLTGETTWSSCSGQSIRCGFITIIILLLLLHRANHRLSCLSDRPLTSNWDHNDTMMVPGYFYPAQEQCRSIILLQILLVLLFHPLIILTCFLLLCYTGSSLLARKVQTRQTQRMTPTCAR